MNLMMNEAFDGNIIECGTLNYEFMENKINISIRFEFVNWNFILNYNEKLILIITKIFNMKGACWSHIKSCFKGMPFWAKRSNILRIWSQMIRLQILCSWIFTILPGIHRRILYALRMHNAIAYHEANTLFCLLWLNSKYEIIFMRAQTKAQTHSHLQYITYMQT